MQKSFTATLEAYGEAACQTLAVAWVSRMQFFFDLVELEGPHFVFADNCLGDFVEDAEVETLHAAGNAAVRSRTDQVRKLRPRK